jgi:hypothetical protein
MKKLKKLKPKKAQTAHPPSFIKNKNESFFAKRFFLFILSIDVYS